ncbi:MAG: hypothetical protein ACLU38_05850 [Dysosmobacter sp.]
MSIIPSAKACCKPGPNEMLGTSELPCISASSFGFQPRRTPQAASIVILHDEPHKRILLLFRQADADLMQFIFQVLNDFR